MKLKGYFALLFLLLVFPVFSACGDVKGEYLQLQPPFSSETAGSEAVNSDETASTDENIGSEDTSIDLKLDNNVLVRVIDYIPDAKIDIKYATADNFTKGKIYDFDDAYLRYGTVIKLKKAADSLREKGYRIVIWDGYRPQSAQFVLFENAPDPTFVSDPNNGFSSHSSGATVDITLIKADGSTVEMPSGFDEFSDKANRNYDDVSDTAANNSKILEKAMQDAGFSGYSAEWWHYTDTNSYGYDDIKNVKPASKSKKTYKADCEEFISLRSEPSTDAEVIGKIPADAEITPQCWIDKYVGVVFEGKFGYVSSSFVK